MPVKRRLALVFPGFEPMPVEAHAARFMREAAKAAPVFDMDLRLGAPKLDGGGATTASIDVTATTEGAETATQVVIYGLGDLNRLYAGRNPLARILTGVLALGDFVISGTFLRFVRTSWRYGLFFLYPLVILAAAVLIALAAGHLLPLDAGARPLAQAAALAALLWLASAKMHFLLMMDDWSCARDIAYDRRSELARRIEAVAGDVRRRIAAAEADEVVLAAHSFGAISAVLALGKALAAGAPMPPTGLLTAGSSLLKAGLHPAAFHLREAVERIVTGDVAWIDAQSLTDPMNFYGSDPRAALGIAVGRSPTVIRVRFRHQLTAETYRAIKRDLFRVHRQFVYAVEKPSAYAFHAMLLGPEPFATLAAQGGLAAGTGGAAR